MKRIFVCFLFLTTLSTIASAQELPVAEWFGGYSYNRIKPDFLAEGANANGWHTNVALNTGFIGFVADFSGHYGKSAGTNLSMTSSLGRGGGQLHSRVSTGVVFRLGKR